MSGVKPFSSINALASVTYEDALQFLREDIDLEQHVLSVVHG